MNKKYYYIVLLCFFSFPFSNIPFNYKKIEIKHSFFNEKSTSYKKNLIYPGKAMLYSAIMPGLGQLYNGDIKRALFFSMIEATAWTTLFINNSKSTDRTEEYKNFANNNWSFERWMKHYYDWQDDDEYKMLFSNTQSDTLYENIWDGSHHLEFTMSHNGNVILISTTDYNNDSNLPSFRDDFYYNDFGTWTPDTTAINELINDPNFNLIKDSHYYENIFKYNHFYSGWSDSDSLTVYDNDGYLIAKSPKKWEYRAMRDDVAKLQRVVTYATSAIMLNHVVSMLDAVWIAKAANKNFNFNLEPIFDYNLPYGVGGLKVVLKW